MSLKRLPRHVTGKASLTCHWTGYTDINWKGYNDNVDYVFTYLQMKFLPGTYSYKSKSCKRELRRIQTHRPHTMGSKEPEPWSPRWVRKKLREKNNGLPPNDPNHDEKTSGRRRKTLMQMWFRLPIPHEFREQYVRQEVLVLPSTHLSPPLGLGQGEVKEGSFNSTFMLHIVNNVIINCYICL
jgi:hypothetical protein